MERLVAETLASLETPARASDSAHRRAVERTVPIDGVEAKLLAYFAARPEAMYVRRGLTRQIRKLCWLVVALLCTALLLGAATAAAALEPGPGAIVNIFWALASLTGLNLLLFGLWLVVMVVLPERPSTHSLGAMAVELWQRLTRRTSREDIDAAARRALLGRLMRPPAGRWIASGLTHGLWLAYGLGAVVTCLLVLSTRHIVFVWETTILVPEDFRLILVVFGTLPSALGFSTPDAAQIAAAEWSGGRAPAFQNADVWSGLLLGGLVTYGVMPRLLALAVSLLRGAKHLRHPLDLARPEFARLIPELAPVMRHSEVISPDDGPSAAKSTQLAGDEHGFALPDPPSSGAVALLGWEIAPPAAGWPPPMAGAGRILDLGCLEDRAALRDAMAVARDENVVRILVVCDLTITPDRGSVASLLELRRSAPAPAMLILSREAAARRRLKESEMRARTADWVAAGHAAGISLDHIVKLDLDRFAATDRQRFARLVGTDA